MRDAEVFAKVIPGHESKSDWLQTIDHPDADLYAQSWQIIGELLKES